MSTHRTAFYLVVALAALVFTTSAHFRRRLQTADHYVIGGSWKAFHHALGLRPLLDSVSSPYNVQELLNRHGYPAHLRVSKGRLHKRDSLAAEANPEQDLHVQLHLAADALDTMEMEIDDVVQSFRVIAQAEKETGISDATERTAVQTKISRRSGKSPTAPAKIP